MTGKTTELPADGIYTGISMEEYRAWPAVHYSALKVICMGGTPAHYQASVNGELDQDTERKTFGRWAHTAILEPALLEMHKPLPDSIKRRTGTAWEQLQAENLDVTFYPPGEWADVTENIEIAKAVAESAHRHPIAADLLSNVDTEVSMLWTDKETGLRCKGRMDAVSTGRRHIADIKMTSRTTPYQIVRAAYGFGYHVQSAFYTDGLKALTGNTPRFWFVFIEENPPHMILVADGHSCYDERDAATNPLGYLQIGREQYKQALKTVADCQASGEWEGYPIEPMEMCIPKWAGFEGV